MEKQFIDSHAHLTSDQLYSDIDQLAVRAQKCNIGAIINICTDAITLSRGLELNMRYPWIYNAAATTPHDLEAEGELLFPIMATAAREGKLVAVGETGLDYYYNHSAPDLQKEFLRRYLQLAIECALPVIIHCREAFGDLFTILDQDYRKGSSYAPGVLHCFTGSVSEAEQVIARGWYLSLSGIVTFKKSTVLRDVAAMVPLSQLLLETDSPYLAPQSQRGKVNEPSYLPEVAAVVAGAKGLSIAEVAEATAQNAKILFNLEARR